MQKDNKFFEDMAKMAQGAAGSLLSYGREIEEMINVRLEKFMQKMNFSTREEMDTALAMLTKIREEQENIKKRLDALEKSQK